MEAISGPQDASRKIAADSRDPPNPSCAASGRKQMLEGASELVSRGKEQQPKGGRGFFFLLQAKEAELFPADSFVSSEAGVLKKKVFQLCCDARETAQAWSTRSP